MSLKPQFGALPVLDSGVHSANAWERHRETVYTYFRKIPKNILSFEPSSGDFSAAPDVGIANDESEAVEAVVEALGEGSNADDPDDVDAIS